MVGECVRTLGRSGEESREPWCSYHFSFVTYSLGAVRVAGRRGRRREAVGQVVASVLRH
jgi:hypothetical protein